MTRSQRLKACFGLALHGGRFTTATILLVKPTPATWPSWMISLPFSCKTALTPPCFWQKKPKKNKNKKRLWEFSRENPPPQRWRSQLDWILWLQRIVQSESAASWTLRRKLFVVSPAARCSSLPVFLGPPVHLQTEKAKRNWHWLSLSWTEAWNTTSGDPQC